MASIVINGDTSGSVTLQAPTVAGSTVITLPSTSGTLASISSVTNNGVVYINSSGQPTSGSGFVFDGTNVGIGTSSPSQPLTVRTSGTSTTAGNNIAARIESNGSGYAATLQFSDNVVNSSTISMVGSATAFLQAGTEAMRINASGNVGIGTSSPTFTAGSGVMVQNATQANYRLADGTNYVDLLQNGGAGYLWNRATNFLSFGTSNTERMRIDSSGNLLVGVTATFNTVGVQTTSTFSTAGAASWAGAFQNTNSGPVGVLVRYNTDVNGTGNSFLYCQGNATLRAEIRSNGGLANYSANNVNLSDERTKTDIQDAGSYLSKICAIPVRTFKYKDQTDDLLNLGVIAQEVEKVAPELVDTSGFGETPEDGIPLKAIYQTDLQYALMKCIQEQQALITQLTERISALEGQA